MKRIIFVINTLGRAGAERALLELLGAIDRKKYSVDLLVLLGQGELITEVPKGVHVLNPSIDPTPVLSEEGGRRLKKWLAVRCLKKGILFRRMGYLVKNTLLLKRNGTFSVNHLARRLLADAADRTRREYDLAVAYIEGGASFYVHDYVRAKKKAAFIHVDYNRAGYNRSLDQEVFVDFDRVFAVSDEVRESFLAAYPECADRTQVFHNLINPERIRRKAEEGKGFGDDYRGFRILTVGRLYAQKAFEVSIDAMRLLRDRGMECRWYVLGEGEEREKLEKQIRQLGLEKDFLLLGAVDNPYPYYRDCDLYVHASRFEGKSIAVQEAQVLGCPILVSDCSGNREQVNPGEDGLICRLSPEGICDAVQKMYEDTALRKRLGSAAAARVQTSAEELSRLDELLSQVESTRTSGG